jgi:branched-chain amino acid transport system substrate-binding protein
LSVAAAATAQAAREGIPVVANVTYETRVPDWDRVLNEVRAARPSILVIATYILDGVDFRRAMLASGLHVDALIGSTMAQCIPDFGAMLGPDAVGVFASDRPNWGINGRALTGVGKDSYERFAEAYEKQHDGYPSEEALAGFSAAWTLFHYVMPGSTDTSPVDLALAARGLDLPAGTLPNGAGVKFSSLAATMGQNVRAASVIWQWQAVRHSVVVYPPEFATGTPTLIPLPR